MQISGRIQFACRVNHRARFGDLAHRPRGDNDPEVSADQRAVRHTRCIMGSPVYPAIWRAALTSSRRVSVSVEGGNRRPAGAYLVTAKAAPWIVVPHCTVKPPPPKAVSCSVTVCEAVSVVPDSVEGMSTTMFGLFRLAI